MTERDAFGTPIRPDAGLETAAPTPLVAPEAVPASSRRPAAGAGRAILALVLIVVAIAAVVVAGLAARGSPRVSRVTDARPVVLPAAPSAAPRGAEPAPRRTPHHLFEPRSLEGAIAQIVRTAGPSARVGTLRVEPERVSALLRGSDGRTRVVALSAGDTPRSVTGRAVPALAATLALYVVDAAAPRRMLRTLRIAGVAARRVAYMRLYGTADPGWDVVLRDGRHFRAENPQGRGLSAVGS